ncbi:MAG: TRAP transporter large permease [Sulfuritalea sp.]|nr:TRAP transporter large permease [Sulfuritalea sp.]
MDTLALAAWSFPLLLLLIFLRIPIGLSMLTLGLLGSWLVYGSLGPLLNQMKTIAYSQFSSHSLSIVPLFLLMGQFASLGGMSQALFKAGEAFLGHRKGGIAMAAIGACAGFGSICGSSLATAATMGQVALPELRRAGYDGGLASGALAAGGTLGILIPPSITLILYGIATETSIGRLFLAGVLPGLLLTGLFVLWTLFLMWKRGFRAHAAEFRYTWKQKFQSIPKVAPFLAIVVGVMYVLYGGIATPSEAAGVGAALCVVMAMAIYRMWNPKQWWAILRDTTRESVMILMIIAASVVFGYMLTSLYLTQTLATAIAELEVNRWVLMALINVFLLVSGCFIPPAAIILMTSPILLPIITAAGLDPVWFGVILTINMEIGLISPPVGLNIYVINAIAPDVRLMQIMRGAFPYVLCIVLAIVILIVFPGIATWLPDQMMGTRH